MPSGLAIGAGIAEGFDNASKNFLSSMQAVQTMRIQREKFEIDKKVSNLQMDKLGLELDPEVHAQQKKLNDMKIKSMQTIMDLNEEKVKQIHDQTTNRFKNFQVGLEFLKTVDPATAARIGIDAKGGMKLSPQAPAKSIPKDVFDKISSDALGLATKRTKNTKKTWWGGSEPEPLAEEVMAAREELISQYRGSPGAAASPQMGGGDGDAASALPDPTQYEDGTTVEDDNGDQYKILNGAWQKVEAE